MDTVALDAIIASYKERFSVIDGEERYKWEAIRCWQDNWDIEASDFGSMLTASIKKANNLLSGAHEFSSAGIRKLAELSSEETRRMFRQLFSDSMPVRDRISAFIEEANGLSERVGVQHHHQTVRAVSTYLTFNQPDLYYFYLPSVFSKVAAAIDYPISGSETKAEKYLQYCDMCDLIGEYILVDKELLHLSHSREANSLFSDSKNCLLVQDIVYSYRTASHGEVRLPPRAKPSIHFKHFSALPVSFKPSMSGITDFESVGRSNRSVGRAGELLVMKLEREKLLRNGLNPDEVRHVSLASDGAGYDIKSFDVAMNQLMYIEVKSTRGKECDPFFISATELEARKQYGDCYYLYRVYGLSDDGNTGSIAIQRGSLEDLCIVPTSFKVIPKKEEQS